MNFKKTWKRFFTVSRASEGFTLVELIVVIAILAILAGIAVPAYSGYIKKANKAADLQLLGAVNTAFAAAALENGKDVNEMADGSVQFRMSTKTVTLYDTEFQKYFAGNTGDFQVIQYVYFQDGVFVENTEGSGSMSREQLQAAVNTYNNSNFAGNEDVLLDTVGDISSLLAEEIGDVELTAFMGQDGYDAFMAEYGLSNESSDTEVANALIMHTASQLSGVTAENIVEWTGGGNLANYENLVEKIGSIPTAALMYGVMTGYANSDAASDDFKEAFQTTPTGVQDVLNMVGTMASDSGWATYLASTSGTGALQDTQGFLAAMQMVSGHDNSFDLTQSDAFTNENAQALLNSILGTNQQQ